DRTLTPGATRSGFRRLLPSATTGPRLLNGAITSLASVAPTVTAESYGAGGSAIDEQPPRPSLPAATDMKMPAARILSTAVCRLPVEQPSSGGHEYELPTTFGRLLGSGFAPLSSVGARKYWRHSM